MFGKQVATSLFDEHEGFDQEGIVSCAFARINK
jgi:hypothetical protein